MLSRIICCLLFRNAFGLEFKYHNNDKVSAYLEEFTGRFPRISETYVIGHSVKGKELKVIQISASDDFLAPNIKFVGNIHGNEGIGREILLNFIEFLGTSYGQNEKVTKLLDSTKIHILPTLNPDGYEVSSFECEGEMGRGNANGVDLNRNFPDYFRNYSKNVHTESETKAVIDWLFSRKFILSAGLHSGALVANYPFDTQKYDTWSTKESKTPDDDVFRHLARTYSFNHTTMYKGETCIIYDIDDYELITSFKNGITNGAEWYSFRGGMQDYNYAFHGCMELTLELSCCKNPMSNNIETIWLQNKNALLEYSLQAHQGVRGILDLKDYPLSQVRLKIKGRDIYFTTDNRGRFWRLLLPGHYELQVEVNEKPLKSVRFEVHSTRTTRMTTLNISMVEDDDDSGTNGGKPFEEALSATNIIVGTITEPSTWTSSSSDAVEEITDNETGVETFLEIVSNSGNTSRDRHSIYNLLTILSSLVLQLICICCN